MGKFIYEGSVRVNVEDRLLAHLQLVINSKLRRGESFPFTWRDDASMGDGRTSVWLHSQASLVYIFRGSQPPSLNPAWIDALTYTANSASGLHVVPEPVEGPDELLAIDEIP